MPGVPAWRGSGSLGLVAERSHLCHHQGWGGMSFCAHRKAPKEGPCPWLHILHRCMLHHKHRTPPPCLLATWLCSSPTPGVAASPTCLLLPRACVPSIHSCHPASTHAEQHSRARHARSTNRLRTFLTGAFLSPRQTPRRRNHWAGGDALRLACLADSLQCLAQGRPARGDPPLLPPPSPQWQEMLRWSAGIPQQPLAHRARIQGLCPTEWWHWGGVAHPSACAASIGTHLSFHSKSPHLYYMALALLIPKQEPLSLDFRAWLHLGFVLGYIQGLPM